jgi:hypothetical protein
MEPVSEALTIVNSVIQSSHKDELNLMRSSEPGSLLKPKDENSILLGLPEADDYAHQYIPPSPEPREYLSWKFHDMNLLVGSDALIYRSANDPQSKALTVRVEDASNMKALLERHKEMIESGSFIADHQFEKLQQQGKPSYADATRRTLQQIEDEKHVEAGDSADTDSSKTNKQTKSDSIHEARSFAAPDFDRVQLQTCIVPAPGVSVGSLLSTANDKVVPSPDASTPKLSPVSTVLDTYLDNIMANVPQLALCLREKGFIQSVKLLNTESIPSRLLQSSTVDTSTPFETISDCSHLLMRFFHLKLWR